MKTYCVKCKKDTENIDPKIVITKNNRLLMQTEAKGLLSNLEIKTPLSKIPLLLMNLKTNMIQKVNQKFIFSYLLTNVIKEHEDLLCKV